MRQQRPLDSQRARMPESRANLPRRGSFAQHRPRGRHIAHPMGQRKQRQTSQRICMRMPCNAAGPASRLLRGSWSVGAGTGVGAAECSTDHMAWWRQVEVTPLSKEPSPQDFKNLRPMNMLESSRKLPSRLLLQVSEEFGIGPNLLGHPDPCMLGFRKGHQCMELISVVRSTAEKCMEWDYPLIICQLDVARAYYSVRRRTPCTEEAPPPGDLLHTCAT